MRVTYIDKVPSFRGTNGYVCTNEEIPVHERLLSGRTFSNPATICSGGDVPLLLLLNRSEKVTAVDHSYVSISWALHKFAMIEDLGARRFYDLVRGPFKDFNKESERVRKRENSTLPQEVRATSPIADYTFQMDLSPIYKDVSFDYFDGAVSKLDRLTIMHGDIRDLEGDHDFLYTSNAHEHQCRFEEPRFGDYNYNIINNNRLQKLEAFYSKLAPGGLLLFTSYAMCNFETLNLTSIAIDRGHKMSWGYHLYQKPSLQFVAA